VILWAGGKKLAALKVPPGVSIPDGPNLVITCNRPQKFKLIRLSADVTPPADDGDSTARPERFVVALRNGDRFSAAQVTMQQGEYRVMTGMAELSLPADKVARISTPAEDRHMPRRQQGDARAALGSGAVTLVPRQLTGGPGGVLMGQCDYLGEVEINREAMRRLDMNIWK
jgi:hypothetical protein